MERKQPAHRGDDTATHRASTAPRSCGCGKLLGAPSEFCNRPGGRTVVAAPRRLVGDAPHDRRGAATKPASATVLAAWTICPNACRHPARVTVLKPPAATAHGRHCAAARSDRSSETPLG